MKSPHNVILSFLICILSLVALTSCSPSASSLVGEWQSSKPESVHLSIKLGASANDGFHDGFSFAQAGRTYTMFWRIRNESGRTILDLSPGGGLSNLPNIMVAQSVQRKIIELTSEKLVVEWGSFTGGNLAVYEFRRVK